MSNKSPFGSVSHFGNIGSWKAGSHTSDPLLLRAQSRQLFISLQQSHSTVESTITALRQILEAITPWPNLCFSAWDRLFLSFPAAAMKGWAWCNHNAELVDCAAALRNLLLAGSGWLKFPKGVAGIDSLNKHVEQISFRHCVTFLNIGSWKAGSHTSNPLLLKAQSRQLFIGLQQSHSTTESTITAL